MRTQLFFIIYKKILNYFFGVCLKRHTFFMYPPL